MKAAVAQFAGLLGFWFLLSARTEPLFVAMGVASVAVVTAVTRRSLADVAGDTTPGLGAAVCRVWRFGVFLLWLLSRIPPSAWQIASLALRPSLPIQPHVVTFTTGLSTPLARTVLANSISLVPGTATLEVDGDRFVVHALVPSAADDLRTAQLQNRIAEAFGQPRETPPVMVWKPPLTTESRGERRR